MKKVFASDFDGTLYFYKAEDDRKLPAENVEKIREYQKAGHLFGLCTGRQVGGLTMHYDAEKGVCTFDKSKMTNRCNEQVGEVLDMPLANGLRKLEIFVDRSSVEYFANDGEATFTAHSYPTAEEFNYTTSGDVQVKIWKMKASVKDDFVV